MKEKTLTKSSTDKLKKNYSYGTVTPETYNYLGPQHEISNELIKSKGLRGSSSRRNLQNIQKIFKMKLGEELDTDQSNYHMVQKKQSAMLYRDRKPISTNISQIINEDLIQQVDLTKETRESKPDEQLGGEEGEAKEVIHTSITMDNRLKNSNSQIKNTSANFNSMVDLMKSVNGAPDLVDNSIFQDPNIVIKPENKTEIHTPTQWTNPQDEHSLISNNMK